MDKMGCGISMVKYILFFLNVICLVCGMLAIGFGVNIMGYGQTIPAAQTIPIATIVLGGIIFLISFVGCCGTLKENHCMMITYSVILLILAIVQIAATVFLFVGPNGLEKVLEELFDAGTRGNVAAKETFEAIEKSAHCCGKTSPYDYPIADIPKSCCGPEVMTCTQLTAYKEGCVEVVSKKVHAYFDVLSYVSIAIWVTEAVAFVFACSLASHIRGTQTRTGV